jgi:hypothetical protein
VPIERPVPVAIDNIPAPIELSDPTVSEPLLMFVVPVKVPGLEIVASPFTIRSVPFTIALINPPLRVTFPDTVRLPRPVMVPELVRELTACVLEPSASSPVERMVNAEEPRALFACTVTCPSMEVDPPKVDVAVSTSSPRPDLTKEVAVPPRAPRVTFVRDPTFSSAD